MKTNSHVKPICFYLPQFHTIPENDHWWGEGFTEWNLVKSAKPLFASHRQPVLPHRDLGYYDLTEPDTRRKQGDLARQYGIYGFCYYHYWFSGKRLLQTPLEQMLEDNYPDLPYCLCWANEPWSRRWSGDDEDVLQAQVYGGQDDWENHFNLLCRHFGHRNYIRIEEKPVFLIYRIGHMPNAGRMIAMWRQLASDRGFPGLHIVAIEGGFSDNKIVPAYVDATAEHQPSCVLSNSRPLVVRDLKVLPVEQIWELSQTRKHLQGIHYPGVCHAWDNTPRRGRDGCVVLPSRPERFGRHLSRLFERVRTFDQQPFVFFNAWNEWSEGACLEPDQEFGYRWLECIESAIGRPAARLTITKAAIAFEHPITPAPEKYWSRSILEPDVDLLNTFVLHGAHARKVADFGCGSGVTSEHLRNFTGADRYVGLEPDARRIENARSRLDEVYHVDADIPDLSRYKLNSVDLVICRELLGQISDPVLTLRRLRDAMADDSLACLGFFHAGHHSRVEQLLNFSSEGHVSNGHVYIERTYSFPEAKDIVHAAGFETVEVYKVFSGRQLSTNQLEENGNSVKIGGIRISGLTKEQVENLWCLRFFLFARPVSDKGRGNK